MDYGKVSLERHREWRGKIEIALRAEVNSDEALSLAYTPGVAAPCLEIQKDPDIRPMLNASLTSDCYKDEALNCVVVDLDFYVSRYYSKDPASTILGHRSSNFS